MPINPEYLRRNLLVCKAVGANANAKAARKRLQAQRRPAKWLLDYLQGIIDRTEGLAGELACYRAAVPVNVEMPHLNGSEKQIMVCELLAAARAELPDPDFIPDEEREVRVRQLRERIDAYLSVTDYMKARSRNDQSKI